jgi:choline kinase
VIDFQAIILAAGRGTRMNLTTKKIPKCLLHVGKKTILDRQIDILLKNGIKDILIVTGYKSDLIKKHLFKKNIKIVYNKNYKKYDNLFSIWSVKDFIKTNFICIYGDLIFNEKLLSSFLQSSNSSLIVDKPLHVYDSHSVIIKESLIKNINFDTKKYVPSGQFIGILKFNDDSINLFKKGLDFFYQNNDLNGEFVRLIKFLLDKIDIHAFPIKQNIWINVNDGKNYEIAKNLFS